MFNALSSIVGALFQDLDYITKFGVVRVVSGVYLPAHSRSSIRQCINFGHELKSCADTHLSFGVMMSADAVNWYELASLWIERIYYTYLIWLSNWGYHFAVTEYILVMDRIHNFCALSLHETWNIKTAINFWQRPVSLSHAPCPLGVGNWPQLRHIRTASLARIESHSRPHPCTFYPW